MSRMNEEQLTKHKTNIEKFGFTILRNCFSESQIAEYREKIVNFFSDDEGNLVNNLNENYRDGTEPTRPLAINEAYFDFLYPIFEKNPLTETLKFICEGNLRYCHHFDVHVDTVAGKGWHRDSLNNSEGRMAPNWKDLYAKTSFWSNAPEEKYQVYRIAIYCQDHSKNEDGLFLLANSHSHDPIDKLKVKEIYAKTNIGDVIIFDARCLHRGGKNVRRGHRRTAIFFAMGADNLPTIEHTSGALARQKYQNKLEKYKISDSLAKLLDSEGILY